MNNIYAVILAAGKGTRMKSKLYKVLHPVCGKPMVQHVVDQVSHMKISEIVVVIGHGAQQVKEQLGDRLQYALQTEQLGTGHAVQITRELLEKKQGTTIVLCGDTPLICSETLQELVQFHLQEQAAATILTAKLENPTGYGRIIRSETGQVLRIVEQKDASLEEQQINEINTGLYCFDNQKMWEVLDKLTNQNAQGEYYLTDCIQLLEQSGQKVSAYLSADPEETMGVNDRVALAEAERSMRKRINHQHMVSGVTLIDPEHTYIGPDVSIGMDTVIYPGSIIDGETIIGEDCQIGPNTELHNVQVGNGCSITQSVVLESKMGQHNSIGPFAYIRPHCTIGDYCKLGDFVELKNTTVADHSKIPHLSYIGDAQIGREVNMGCGSITVNYDGANKHQTVVEDGCFVGCNVNLVAPVTIGKDSFIAAGSTITKDVPVNSFAVARERETIKENYRVKSQSSDIKQNENKSGGS